MTWFGSRFPACKGAQRHRIGSDRCAPHCDRVRNGRLEGAIIAQVTRFRVRNGCSAVSRSLSRRSIPLRWNHSMATDPSSTPDAIDQLKRAWGELADLDRAQAVSKIRKSATAALAAIPATCQHRQQATPQRVNLSALMTLGRASALVRSLGATTPSAIG
jgi:hypothetical protein